MNVITRTPEQVYKRWIKALKSGKYKQGTQLLYALNSEPLGNDVGFCCLGVLCDLAAKDGGEKWDKTRYTNGAAFMNRTKHLPVPIRNFLGMTKAEQKQLIELNDSRGWSFFSLANVIEREIMPNALTRLEKRNK